MHFDFMLPEWLLGGCAGSVLTLCSLLLAASVQSRKGKGKGNGH